MRWWIFFLVSCKTFAVAVDSEELVLSTPEEIVSLDTSLLVEGFVSAASGQLSLMETDLAIEAAQDLLLNRVYISPQIFGRYHDKDEYDRLELGKALFRLPHKQWETLPHLWAHFKGNRVWIPDPSGTVLEFQVEGNRGILKTPSMDAAISEARKLRQKQTFAILSWRCTADRSGSSGQMVCSESMTFVDSVPFDSTMNGCQIIKSSAIPTKIHPTSASNLPILLANTYMLRLIDWINTVTKASMEGKLIIIAKIN